MPEPSQQARLAVLVPVPVVMLRSVVMYRSAVMIVPGAIAHSPRLRAESCCSTSTVAPRPQLPSGLDHIAVGVASRAELDQLAELLRLAGGNRRLA
jgi:hypothetical protein